MSKENALGIIFPNLHEETIPDLVGHRSMASIPFGGRYRLIDFSLSCFTNAGIRNIGIVVRQNYQSLMAHLGNGREWDLSSKRGGLVIFPPYGRESTYYSGRIQGLASILQYLEERREPLVVMSDCNIAFHMNIKDLLHAHLDSGADVTAVYERSPIVGGLKNDNYTFSLDENGFLNEVRVQEYRKGTHCVGMEIFVIGREFLISVVREAMAQSKFNFMADVIAPNLNVYRVYGYEHTGYRARIHDMRSYYEENLRLLKPGSLEALFPQHLPILTKVHDESPVVYAIGSKVQNSLLADGCSIEGNVQSSMLSRGVRVGKNAEVHNCVLMQGTQIEPGAYLENVITDKNVVVQSGQQLVGATNFPIYIRKNSVVGSST